MNTMRAGQCFKGRLIRLIPAVLLAALAASGPVIAGEVVLSGRVTSAAEPVMEGVIVSARRVGTPITVSVVSDATGQYRFRSEHLSPGRYELGIRATGFELPVVPVELVVGAPAKQDLQLAPAQAIDRQMTNAEWISSMPGTPAQKADILACVACHTLDRVVHSRYSEDEFLRIVLPRMQSYVNQSMPGAPQIRKGARLMEEQGEDRVNVYRALAQYLAQINLHGRETWTYPLKPFARLTGESTRVLITEYDLPRPLIQPHDVIIDPQGMVWFSSFGEQMIGSLDPATGAVREFRIPVTKPEYPTGVLGVRQDREGMIWIGNMYQASIARFDPKAGVILQSYSPPASANLPATQLNQPAPFNRFVDGKVWAQNSGFAGVHRIDLATGAFETWAPFKGAKEPHNIYDVATDSSNNAFFTDYRQQEIGRIDAKTGEVRLYTLPTRDAGPRRGTMDDQDRFWFGEYRGHNIGMLDTRSGQIREWKVPTPYAAPYDAILDRSGHAWTGSMTTDRVARLDVASNRMVEYALPRSTNIRRVFVDNSQPVPVLWIGSNHGASILSVAPLAD